MLSLLSINNDSQDCLYSSIASVVSSMCCYKHEMIGAGAWWFDLKEPIPGQDNLIWNRINAFCYDAWNSLEDYYGIKVTWHNARMVDEILPIMQRELAENRPVLVYINSHFCPWHPRKNEYNAHFCLVVRFDQESQNLICMDVNPVKYEEKLSLELFSQGCGPYITFSRSNKPCKSIDWKEIISNTIDRFGLNNNLQSFNLIRQLSYELTNEINAFQDCIPYWIENPVPVVLNVGLLQKGRKYFSTTLKYLAEQYNIQELIPISNHLLQAAQQWNAISFLSIKSNLNKDDRRSLLRIPQKILEIADFEEEIALDLISLVRYYS